MSIGHEVSKVVIPPEMEQFTDPDKIAANKNNYPELSEWKPDRHEQEALKHVREMLLDIKLSHATRPENLESIQNNGIVPCSELQNEEEAQVSSNTFEIDKLFGLHHYGFFYWGAFHETEYGDFVFPVDTRKILLSPNTIVTPHDIFTITYGFREVSTLDERDMEYIQTEYIDTIVSGSDWVDVVARRALRHMIHESTNRDYYPIPYAASMGEIKHLGVVPSQHIGEPVNIWDSQAIHPIWRSMLAKNGVTVATVTRTLEALWDWDEYSLPYEIGPSIRKSRKKWRKILDIAQKS